MDVSAEKEGSVLVPGRLFSDLISRLPAGQDIVIETTDDVLKVSAGFSDYEIRILPDENFPTLPLFEDAKLSELDSGEFKSALTRTSFCALKDPTGTTTHYTQGVLINFQEESLDLVGTDGHRLAYVRLQNPSPEIKDKNLLIPTVVIDELRKALPSEGQVSIYSMENQVFFRFDGTIFAGTLFDIRFPDYKKVIPKEPKSVINVNRAALRDAVQRVMVVFRVKEQNPVVRLQTKDDVLLISSESPEVGKGVEELVFTKGEPFKEMRIALNPAYLTDVLSVLDSETVDIHWVSEVNPLKILIPENPSFTYIVMPIRMD